MCSEKSKDLEQPTSTTPSDKPGVITSSTAKTTTPTEREPTNTTITNTPSQTASATAKYTPAHLTRVTTLSEDTILSIQTLLEGANDAIQQERNCNPYVKNTNRHGLYNLGYHWTILKLTAHGARTRRAEEKTRTNINRH